MGTSNWTAATSWDNITATTINKYVQGVQDLFFRKSPLQGELWRRRKVYSGGDKIAQPVSVGVAASSGTFANYDTLSTVPYEFMKQARVPWRHYYGSVINTRDEEIQNNGPQQIVDLLGEKFTNARKQLEKNMAQGFFSDGTSTTYPDGSVKGFDGLKVICDDGTNYTYYAELSRSDGSYGSYWKAQYTNVGGNLTYAKLRTMLGDIAEDTDGEKPHMIVTTYDIDDFMRTLLEPKQFYTNTMLAPYGIQTWNVEGIPVVPDTYCPSGCMFFINFDYLTLFVAKKDIDKRDMEKPINQEVKVGRVFVDGNIICKNPQAQGQLCGITTT